MPQPDAVRAAADELIALYREAHDALVAELAEAMRDDRDWRRRRRLRQLIAQHADMVQALTEATRGWLTATLPQIHALGAAAALPTGVAFRWTQTHVDAVTSLALRTWDDVAANLQALDASGRRGLRRLARGAGREVIVEGRTAAQSGRRFAQWAARQGIGSVTYADGSIRTIGDYADTVVRTVSAQSYNDGTLTQVADDGIEWVEIFDGPACGWTSHADPDKANGTIRTLAEANEYPLSHPRCARSFGPRPDITNAEQAAAGRRYSEAEQAAMAAAEDERARTAPVTLTGRRRAGRVARVGRG